MPQKAIEVILTRQLASCLAMPIIIASPDGTLIYYNDSAERVFGLRFAESGEMTPLEWSTKFDPTDGNGAPVPPEDLPLSVALAEHRPAHGSFWIRGLDGPRRRIAVTAFPIIGQAERALGAVAIIWETAE